MCLGDFIDTFELCMCVHVCLSVCLFETHFHLRFPFCLQHGREYNESPARMLSQSFHLDIVGGKPITAKQTLLGAVDTVIKSHVPHRRGEDSYFKAFICLALKSVLCAVHVYISSLIGFWEMFVAES